jgi:hypothetical protein
LNFEQHRRKNLATYEFKNSLSYPSISPHYSMER